MTATYEIRVQGELPADWSDWIEGTIELRAANGETLLRGEFDQAALHGVLRRLCELNLTLIAVQREPGSPAHAR
jgi:hypothetical protein